MKAKSFFYLLFSLSLILAGGFMSCEGPEGRDGRDGQEGPIGPAGPQGPAGVQGIQGMAGTTNCIQCHGASQLIAGKMLQYKLSKHYAGGHYYENRASCAVCHTSQGFLEVLQTEAMSASADVVDPLPPNCYACHMIHTTYTSEDWAFTNPDPVTFWATGTTADIGRGNQCIQCHQARIRELDIPWDPAPPPLDSDTMIYLSTTRYGPHHGAQGMVFTGNGGSKNASFSVTDNSFHRSVITNGCVTCHMATFDPELAAGGHTFAIVSEEGELNDAGCAQCHLGSGEAEDLKEEVQSEIKGLLYELSALLMEEGLLRDTVGNNAWRTNQDTFPSYQIGALYNAIFIAEDKSFGVHNYKYTKKLLEESIKVMEN